MDLKLFILIFMWKVIFAQKTDTDLKQKIKIYQETEEVLIQSSYPSLRASRNLQNNQYFISQNQCTYIIGQQSCCTNLLQAGGALNCSNCQTCLQCQNKYYCLDCVLRSQFINENGYCLGVCDAKNGYYTLNFQYKKTSSPNLSYGNQCLKCHQSCKTCNGNSENNCLTCQDSLQLQQNKQY
ncbi:zinc finger, LSD1 subclass family protein, putative (macronuclear) [Tetrahymena thermophila SB210]|uniref:Zinc finger, LSD1 subclass family protein, putative n=1 Tax=Tetrahymena thermophila (strain SB210) TaxID=312017 RepID=W7X7P2_TETTS|nr:zinc finger, LSD1 subclass family protein, putative [Tetrahymena thermophila SB210]EWS75385.1 zinc finger, LSD1 subclass family protein, putative [Tetrahymena thermophila SB210]|eukprot:XP_012652059.1 zinc finger, LSD1 subclass family protein, putative [Tetrahymena thermophila SB210]